MNNNSESHEAIKFSGNLAVDSEKLFNKLKKSFQPNELDFLCALYYLRKNFQILEEQNLNRSIGANYNPKVARIALLYLEEGKSKNLEVLSGILLLACPSDLKIEPPFSNPMHVAGELQELINNPVESNVPESFRPALEAALLDEIRHLHMELRPVSNILSRIDEIDNYLIKSPESTLRAKCSHALSLQRQKFSQKS